MRKKENPPGAATPGETITIEKLESLIDDVNRQISNNVRIKVTGSGFELRHKEVRPKCRIIENLFDHMGKLINRGIAAIDGRLGSHRCFKRVCGLRETRISKPFDHVRD